MPRLVDWLARFVCLFVSGHSQKQQVQGQEKKYSNKGYGKKSDQSFDIDFPFHYDQCCQEIPG
jgi:hypothetical protein